MEWLHSLSIKTKITIIILMVSLTSVGIGFLFIIISSIRDFKAELINNSKLTSKLVSEFCVAPLTFQYYDKVQEVLSKLAFLPPIYNAQIFNEEGLMVASYHKPDAPIAQQPTKLEPFILIDDNSLHIYDSISSKNRNYGYIYLHTSTLSYQKKINEFYATIAMILAGLVLITFAFASFFQKIISKPLLDLALITEKITAQSDYSIRVKKQSNDEIGALYDAFNNMMSQITKWQAEQKKAAEQLRESQELFSLFMNMLPAMAFIKEKDGTYKYVNQYLINNFNAYQWLYRKAFEIMDSEPAQKIIETDGQALNEIVSFEQQLKDKFGQNRNYETLKFPIKQLDKPTLIGGIAIEITNRIEAERQIKFYIAELERNYQELEEFNYVASHDLREPLRTLTSYCELLKEDIGNNLSDNAREDINFIMEASGRMNVLIQDLLMLSRAGRMDFKNLEVDLNLCVANVLRDLELTIKETNAEIIVEKLPVVAGDIIQIGRVFLNLISNALKFKSKGNPVIQIFAKPIKTKWQITVKDNGIGIEKQYLEAIFLPFKRLHSRSKYEGTGIGLAICKKIIKRHNGDIFVTSVYGKGAEFKFTLDNFSKI